MKMLVYCLQLPVYTNVCFFEVYVFILKLITFPPVNAAMSFCDKVKCLKKQENLHHFTSEIIKSG